MDALKHLQLMFSLLALLGASNLIYRYLDLKYEELIPINLSLAILETYHNFLRNMNTELASDIPKDSLWVSQEF